MVRSQSKTLNQAVAEYKRRHKRSPPPGFDKWFALCLENSVIFVGEFKGMMQAMEPFWAIPPLELRHRVEVALPAEGMCKIAVENGTFEDECWFSTEMRDMTNLGVDLLPDMAMAINSLDEPRVVVPHDLLDELRNRPTSDPTRKCPSRHKTQVHRHQRPKTWDHVTLSCAVDSPARSWQAAKLSNFTLFLITNMTDATDLCLRPELAQQHGFFVFAYLLLANEHSGSHLLTRQTLHIPRHSLPLPLLPRQCRLPTKQTVISPTMAKLTAYTGPVPLPAALSPHPTGRTSTDTASSHSPTMTPTSPSGF